MPIVRVLLVLLALASPALAQDGARDAAVIHDTREVWASYFLPPDRTQMIELLAGLAKRVPDETARIDLAAFTAALQAVN